MFSGQMSLEKPQAEYLSQYDGHNGWMESHQNQHGRPGMNTGPVRSFGGGAVSSLPHSISATLDPFTGDLPVQSAHINYSPGFTTTHGNSGHQEL